MLAPDHGPLEDPQQDREVQREHAERRVTEGAGQAAHPWCRQSAKHPAAPDEPLEEEVHRRGVDHRGEAVVPRRAEGLEPHRRGRVAPLPRHQGTEPEHHHQGGEQGPAAEDDSSQRPPEEEVAQVRDPPRPCGLDEHVRRAAPVQRCLAHRCHQAAQYAGHHHLGACGLSHERDQHRCDDRQAEHDPEEVEGPVQGAAHRLRHGIAHAQLLVEDEPAHHEVPRVPERDRRKQSDGSLAQEVPRSAISPRVQQERTTHHHEHRDGEDAQDVEIDGHRAAQRAPGPGLEGVVADGVDGHHRSDRHEPEPRDPRQVCPRTSRRLGDRSLRGGGAAGVGRRVQPARAGRRRADHPASPLRPNDGSRHR